MILFIFKKKKFVNRGFLKGPWLPIYGCGMILILVLLSWCMTKPLLMFILIILLCGFLEYMTSYLLEKLFHKKWWDYKDSFLNINGTTVMFSDCPPNIPLKFGNNTALVINKDNTEEIKELFNALKDGGLVIMDLQETFWSKLYGFVEDKYGVLWHLIYTGK